MQIHYDKTLARKTFQEAQVKEQIKPAQTNNPMTRFAIAIAVSLLVLQLF